MRIPGFIRNRPFISLTLLYIALLVVMDNRGFFVAPPRGDVSGFGLQSAAEIRGIVTSVPAKRNNKVSFTVRVAAVNGYAAGGHILVNCFDTANVPEQNDDVLFYGKLLQLPCARNPGQFDYAGYLRRNGIYTITYASRITRLGHVKVPFYRSLAASISADMIETIRKTIPDQEAGVLIPMLIGDKSGLTDDEKTDFTDAGVMHVLVVSGFNVAYVAGFFLILFRIAGFRRRIAAPLTIPFILLYMFMTGFSPPVVRATVMAVFIILSLCLSREPLIYQSLALSAAAILIFDPQALFTASFQLSFAATIGIVYLYPVFMAPFSRLPRWLGTTLGGTIAVSFAAQLAVAPLIAYYFNKVSLAGLASNIPIVPLSGLITTGGLLLYIVHFISPAITAPVALITYYLVHVLLWLVHFFANLPLSTLRVPTPGILFIASYYLFVWVTGRIYTLPKKTMAFSWLVLGTAMVLFLPQRSGDNYLRITALSLGNGSAVHVAFPQGRDWLINTGSAKDEERIICPYLWSRGVRRLDKIILTRNDASHNGGTDALLNNFPVSEVVREPACEKVFVVGGSTVTLHDLNVIIDHNGQRITLPADEKICIEEGNKTASVLLSSRGFVIVTGARKSRKAPENLYNGQVYDTKKCGAVTVLVKPEGIETKTFLKQASDEEAED